MSFVAFTASNRSACARAAKLWQIGSSVMCWEGSTMTCRLPVGCLGGCQSFPPSNLVRLISMISWHCARSLGCHFWFLDWFVNTARLWSFWKWYLKRTPKFEPFNKQYHQQYISIYITNTKVSLKVVKEPYLPWSHLMIPPNLEHSSQVLSIQTEHLWRSKALVDTCVASTSSVGSE